MFTICLAILLLLYYKVWCNINNNNNILTFIEFHLLVEKNLVLTS